MTLRSSKKKRSKGDRVSEWVTKGGWEKEERKIEENDVPTTMFYNVTR